MDGLKPLKKLHLPEYDYDALDKIRAFQKLLMRRIHEKQRVISLSMNSVTFRAAERVYEGEMKRLEKVIQRLIKQRNSENAALRNEVDLTGAGLEDENAPGHPYSTYDDHRLTKRGVEICYRLFDLGKSTLAVAHLFAISLDAARNRRKLWLAVGGKERLAVDLDALPKRRFYRHYDD
jgi:hypothetical protein